ncbi:MAG: sigma-70 family RNA polymerase sigma factor [Patescibacteria group bacterium]|nr:sigma-70 family RNA polymerase sigma factor [Patescibacteria group bacterium]
MTHQCMELDERTIIRRIQAGDFDDFHHLYDAYARRIYLFIYYRTYHKETAEDLTSEAFLKAFRGIGSFDAAKGTFGAWLYRIARNVVIDHYRTAHPTVDMESIWDLSTDDDVAQEVDVRQDLDRVRGYLKDLKPEQRSVIIMRVWDELSYQEIADITGKSVPSLKMMFSRAIAQLRRDLPLGMLLLALWRVYH